MARAPPPRPGPPSRWFPGARCCGPRRLRGELVSGEVGDGGAGAGARGRPGASFRPGNPLQSARRSRPGPRGGSGSLESHCLRSRAEGRVLGGFLARGASWRRGRGGGQGGAPPFPFPTRPSPSSNSSFKGLVGRRDGEGGGSGASGGLEGVNAVASLRVRLRAPRARGPRPRARPRPPRRALQPPAPVRPRERVKAPPRECQFSGRCS